MKRFVQFSITFLLLLSLFIPFGTANIQEAAADNPDPVQIFYITLPETDALTVLDTINTAANSPMTGYFTIAVGVTGTWFYYDNWENGYITDLANPSLSEGARKARASFEERYGSNPDLYGKVDVVNWGAVSRTLPENKYDFILTARSIHGWMQDKPGTVEATFGEFYKALKPGGILAVEQHRANPLPPGAEEKPATGYVSEAYVISVAEKAGFKLAAKSEINANAKDTKDHPFGVWTLPPALRSTAYGSGQAEDPNFDHSKYLAIGESDRMTLKFVKAK